MNSRTETELKNFFIFNTAFGPKEGQELQKILYYHPITDNVDVQIKNVGLIEGIIQFTRTFKTSSPVQSLHTQKSRQLYYQPEENYWLVLTLNLPTVQSVKDCVSNLEYIEDDVHDNIYEAVLKQAYEMYRLFWGTFEQTTENEGVEILKTRLEHFYKAYLKTLKLANCDMQNIFSGIQYLPLDKVTFLKVQCFINLLECNYPQIEYTAFLYNDHLIWSGVEPNDMKTIYRYLIGTLLPANMETELQGGSMPRNASSPFLGQGCFLTGLNNLKPNKSVGKIPKVYLFHGAKSEVYFMVVYRALSTTICLFIKTDAELTLDFFKQLNRFISPQLSAIVSDIADYCSKQVLTPSSLQENSPRFIYFNKFNLAYKSTTHLDNKQLGSVVCNKELSKVIADLSNKKSLLGYSGQVIVKTMNDFWVALRVSNMREFYIVLQQKNVNLTEINLSVEKLCENELKGIFFHPV